MNVSEADNVSPVLEDNKASDNDTDTIGSGSESGSEEEIVYEPNIHQLATAVIQGDLNAVEQLLIDDQMVIPEDKDLDPLYLAIKHEQETVFSRLMDDPRLNHPDRIEELLHQYVLKDDNKTGLALILLDKATDKQTVYENIVQNAAGHIALGLMRTFLEDPKYAEYIQNFNKAKANHLFVWAVNDIFSYGSAPEIEYDDRMDRIDKACALLNTYFKIENLPEFIADQTRQEHNIISYLQHLVHDDDALCTVVEHFDTVGKLIMNPRNPVAELMLWDIEKKLKSDSENGRELRNFDKTIKSIFERVEWRYKISAFDTANKVSSLETLDYLLKRLKEEKLKDLSIKKIFEEIGEPYVSNDTVVSNEMLTALKKPLIKRYVGDIEKMDQKHTMRFIRICSAKNHQVQALDDFLQDVGVKSAESHYRHVVINTVHSKYYVHVDPAIQKQKVDLSINALDLPHKSDFLFDDEDRWQNRDLKEVLCQLSPEAVHNLIKKAAEADNPRLFMLLQKIKSFHRGDKIPADFDCWYQASGGFDIDEEKEPFFEALCFAIEEDHDQHASVKLIIDRLSTEQINSLLQYALYKRGETVPKPSRWHAIAEELKMDPFMASLMGMPAKHHDIPCMALGDGFSAAQFLLDHYNDLTLSSDDFKRFRELEVRLCCSCTPFEPSRPGMVHGYQQTLKEADSPRNDISAIAETPEAEECKSNKLQTKKV